MNPTDTIVALSTPRGRGGLGVIRLSGAGSEAIALQIFTPSSALHHLDSFTSHAFYHGFIHDSGRLIDEVMVCLMRGPRSYTGDDVIEISAHGGPVVLDTIISLCLARGARMAAPGEFTFRAFLNRKIDLSEAEAVADLISGRTALACGAAMKQLQGNISTKVSAWRNSIVRLLSKLEVKLDYGEEDVEFISGAQALAELGILLDDVHKLLASFDKGKFLREGFRAVITGRPNSGKSSLMNALLERERAIVTDIPGTTRDILEEMLDIGGLPVIITDTAGLGVETRDAVEKIGREKAREYLASSDIVLWLIDSSREISDEDRYAADLLISLGLQKRTFVLLAKADLAPAVSIDEARGVFRDFAAYSAVSSVSGAGLRELELMISERAGVTGLSGDAALLVNERHRAILASAGEAVGKAIGGLKSGEGEEITALHLREALDLLGEITGETATEEILNNIFSNFCVGK
jgi:tRNA modification GTPase